MSGGLLSRDEFRRLSWQEDAWITGEELGILRAHDAALRFQRNKLARLLKAALGPSSAGAFSSDFRAECMAALKEIKP